MNYRTMVKGALAFSLSLIVGSSWAAQTSQTDEPAYGATFESAVSTVAPLNDYAYELGSGITNQLYRDEQAAKGWFPGSADDESKIIAGGPTGSTQALQLNTDASTLTNKFASDVAGAVNTALESEGMAFFETEVKFVASDTPGAGIEGGTDATKFAIYAYANEEAEPATTNLVVFHAYQDYDDPTLEEQGYIGYTNEVFSGVTINTEAYTKLRIVMRQIDDNGTPRNLFSVSINGGEPLASAEGLDYEDDIWFLTVEDVGADLDNTKVASLNFKGTGEIDNISVGTIASTTEYAIDWSASEGVVVSNLTDNVELAAGDTNFVAGVRLGFYPTVGTIQSVTVDGAAETVADPYVYTVGTADAIVTVVAAQVLDDNWTIEGFNPRGEWTDPTAVAADSKTLFYSNLVVNIDPIGDGRTIPAAWVGAKVIASEAAVANIANWKFDYDSQDGTRQTNKSFVNNKDGEWFLYWWVPITATEVRTAIATQSDIVKTMAVYADGDSANAQTLTVSICPKNIEITNTSDVPNAETIDVDDWQEQGAVEPTVITVACVGGVTYTEADGVYTFTADTGYEISSIYTNGADTATASTGILDLSAAEGTINVVAAAKKIRTAAAHKWWENPSVVAVNLIDSAWTTGYGPWHMDMDGDFVAATGWSQSGTVAASATGVAIYDVDSLASESAVPLMKRNHDNSDGAGNWSAAVSMPLNVALTGPTIAGTKAIAYSLNASTPVIGENAFIIENDLGLGLYDMEFTPDGQYLYAACYNNNGVSNARNYVYKFRVVNGLKSSGTNLICEAQFNLGDRVRGFTVGHFSGRDVIYALLYTDKSVRALDTSVANAQPVTLIANAGANYGDVAISGIADGTPRLTLAIAYSNSADKLEVYSLAADGLSFASSDPILALDLAALKTLGVPTGSMAATPCVTEDEGTLILGCGNMRIAYIQYVEPQYTATYTGSENVIVTNTYDGSSYQWDEAVAGTQVACLSGTVLSFYPTEGNVITNVTIGGVEQTGFDPACYSITVISDTNLVVLAGASAADDYTAGDTVGAETLNADMAAWLNTKKGTATKAEFEKTLDEDSLTLAEEYLLNTDPTVDTTVEFKISSIAVGDTVDLQVTLTRTEGNEAVTAAINGELQIVGATSLDGTFGNGEAVNATFEGATTAAKSLTTQAKFFKAVIVQKSAPAGN